MLPLDLHVLSLSLAFILSQDQTLRCSNCFMSLLKIPLFSGSSIFDGIHSKYLYYCCICKFLKELFSIVSFETWCKGKDFYFYLPNFFESFFRFIFFGSFFRNDFRTFAWIFQPHPSVYLFPGSSTPLSSCHHRISLDCGCKSTAVKHILQIFSQLFYNYFLLSLIVNDLQMHFSPSFWLDPKETKTSLAIYFTPSPLGRSFLTPIFHPSFFISPSLILNFQSSIIN